MTKAPISSSTQIITTNITEQIFKLCMTYLATAIVRAKKPIHYICDVTGKLSPTCQILYNV
jgi:hypothetical protein